MIAQQIFVSVVTLCLIGLTTLVSAEPNKKVIAELADLLERELGLKDKLNATTENISKQNKVSFMVCPAPDMVHVTNRSEPTCRRDSDCGSGEKCCDWFDNKHCLKEVDSRPKQGSCPALTMWNDMCVGGALGCRYDGDCHGEDEKCCMDDFCEYKKCLSVRQNIACPVAKTMHPTNRTEVTCNKDTECADDERCCDWFSSKHCLKGLDKIPKHGVCPWSPQEISIDQCFMDFVGCEWDSECNSVGINHKCCYNPVCRYGECKDMNEDFVCPILDVDVATANPSEGPSSCDPEDSQACAGYARLCCQTGLTTDGLSVFSCTVGENHPASAGTCPPAEDLADPFGQCLENFEGGCQFDDQCVGPSRKCCETECGYKDCVELGHQLSAHVGPHGQVAVAAASFIPPPPPGAPPGSNNNQPPPPPLKRLLEEILGKKVT